MQSPTEPRSNSISGTNTNNNNNNNNSNGRKKAKANPALQTKIAQLRLTLAPLVSITTGEPHPEFPSSILNFWLLTERQLDELAHFYHQRTPSLLTNAYPESMRWCRAAGLEVKRRKFGRFVGLRGCLTPREENAGRSRSRLQEGKEEEELLWRRKFA